MKIIERPQYMEALLGAKGTPDIKVITGIRRCGKSVLLEALADRIREAGPDANIIRINFNLLEFEELTDYRALHRYVEESYCEGLDNIVMIDEVQTCVGFEKAVNSLHASGKYDIYVTGSNAFLLSSDLATLFRGRTYEVEVFPFSLLEFSTYHGIHNPD
ncbi:ATP-binding protein, partial [Collinsella aerofaciens]|uniref:ATP-binding protein n=2 Tax=Collinsella TaxID=102106 RepID=UPI0034A23B62